MAVVTALTGWTLVAGRYEMAVALDYPATWTDVTGRRDTNVPASPALLIAKGTISAGQSTALSADGRYYVLIAGAGTQSQADVDALSAWLTAHGVPAAILAAYVRTDRSYDQLLADLTNYLRSSVGAVQARVYHVQPATFAAVASAARPGDTLYLAAGTYTPLTISSAGTPDIPITFRSEAGAHVTWDSGLVDDSVWIRGGDLLLRDMEFTNTNPSRLHLALRPYNIQFLSPRTKIINCYIHDGGLGVGYWEAAEDAYLYGCVINNVGWTDLTDANTGHGIYTENKLGKKYIQECILGPAYYLTMQVYTASSASLKGYRISGNCFYGTRHILGGAKPISDMQYTNNFSYNDDVILGFGGTNLDALIDSNVMLTTDYIDVLSYKWNNLTFTHNTLVEELANTALVTLNSDEAKPGWIWNQNTYYNISTRLGSVNGVGWFDLAGWRTHTGFDAASAYNQALPTGAWVYVRANAYDARRAHIFIYNWANASSVSVDLTSLGLPAGNYILRNPLDYYADVVSFAYSGAPVAVPMTGHTQANPVGVAQPLQASPFPHFGAFIVEAAA